MLIAKVNNHVTSGHVIAPVRNFRARDRTSAYDIIKRLLSPSIHFNIHYSHPILESRNDKNG